MKNLGIMNGWKEQPKEYTNHLAECGVEYEQTICYMDGSTPKERTEIARRYDTTITKTGTYSVKRTETCHECGCTWESWS